MSGSINLGNFVTVDGQTTASGVASGLDTAAIVDALVEARRIPIAALEDEIATGEAEISAYGELRTLLTTLQDAVNALRNPPGVNTAADNAFEARVPVLTSSSANDASSFLAAITANGTPTGSFDLQISQLAENQVLRTDTFTSATDSIVSVGGSGSNIFEPGAFSITSTLATAAGNTLTASDYSYTGALSGSFSGGTGISNVVVGSDGGVGLQGGIGTVSAALVGTDLTLLVTINGAGYSSNTIDVSGGSITPQAITFGNDDNTSFDLDFTDTVAIATQTDADNLAIAMTTDAAALSVFQSRRVGNFDVDVASANSLAGLESVDVRFVSNGFDTSNGLAGSLGEFTVTEVTGAGLGDASISVDIDGETYTASGLGDGSDDITGVVTLTAASGRSLTIDFDEITTTINVGTSALATTLQDDLNDVFQTFNSSVTLSDGDTLTEIASNINDFSSTTGVSANIIQISETDFRLSLQSNDEGTDGAFSIVDAGNILTGNPLATDQAAQNAIISLEDITIEREDNVVDDVISGVTFSLFSETENFGQVGGETITIDIQADGVSASNAIVSFVEAYNAFRTFVAEQTERSDDGDGGYVDTAILQNDSTFFSVEQGLSTEVLAIVDGLSASALNSLDDIGITFVDQDATTTTPEIKNVLAIDQTVFSTALAGELEEVRNIFEFNLTSSTSNIVVADRTNALDLTEFQIQVGDPTMDTTVDIYDSTGATLLFTAGIEAVGSSYLITGTSGTDIEGLELLYTGAGTENIDITVSQGIGDRLYNAVEAAVETDGSIDTAVDALNDREDRLQDDIDTLEERIESFRIQQFNIFTALEIAVSQANTILQLLDAQDAVLNSD